MTPSAAKKTRRSHMVTAGYLEAWADSRNVIDVIDLLGEGNGYHSAIRNASVSSYVYETAVLSVDLEKRYGVIESDGLSAIRKLQAGATDLDPREFEAIIAFLDMHYHRGRYADRAGHTVEGMKVSVDLTTGASTSGKTELKYGDMLHLLHQHPDTLRLTDLALETWDWNVVSNWEQLITGDGAALVWSMKEGSDEITSITFPISPTQLLIIGADIPATSMPNIETLAKCRRWIFGQKDTLPLHKASELAQYKRAEEAKRTAGD